MLERFEWPGRKTRLFAFLGYVKTDRKPAGKFLLLDFGKPTLSKSPTLERLTASRQTRKETKN